MSDDDVLPEWVTDLRVLATTSGLVAFLVDFGTDPVGTLQDVVIEIVVNWLLGGILGFIIEVLDLLSQVYASLASIPMLLLSAFLDGMSVVSSLFIGGYSALGTLLTSIAGFAGPVGPILVMVIVAGLLYLTVEVLALLVDTVAPSVGDIIRSVRGLGR